MMIVILKTWIIGILIFIPVNWFASYRGRPANIWISIFWPFFVLLHIAKFIWKIIYILIK